MPSQQRKKNSCSLGDFFILTRARGHGVDESIWTQLRFMSKDRFCFLGIGAPKGYRSTDDKMTLRCLLMSSWIEGRGLDGLWEEQYCSRDI